MISEIEKKRLCEIVGEKWVSDEPAMMDTYSFYMNPEILVRDGGRFAPRPVAVVLPETTEEVRQIMLFCNENDLMTKPISTGFGTWAAVSRDRVIVLDLKRMNRIIDIDVKNQIAIIEPYVRAIDLQTELFKHGLNVHVVSCGGSHSILASTAAAWGFGVTGPTMGYSGRNLLGAEWVMPTGDVLTLGSGGTGAGWFTADGPGPSLRGIMRGMAGTLGGLGVFTKCAVKLYPWDGPTKWEVEGSSPTYVVKGKLPGMDINALSFSSSDDMREAGYKLGESGIEYANFRAGMFFGALGTTQNNQELKFALESGFFQLFGLYSLANVIVGSSKGELDWRRKVLKQIMAETRGAFMPFNMTPSARYFRFLKGVGQRMKDPVSIFRRFPLLQAMAQALPFGKAQAQRTYSKLFWFLIRHAVNTQATFRPSQGLFTTLGSFDTWDLGVKQADWIAKAKMPFIEKGLILDDGGDLGCGGTFEGGHLGYLEGIGLYNTKEPESIMAAASLVEAGANACIKKAMGVPLGGFGQEMNSRFGPHCGNYHEWMSKIKKVFDPNTAADPFFYSEPEK